MSAQPISTSPGSPSPPRLVSLDALRGFDMFWIIGGDLVIRSLPKIHRSRVTEGLADQMEHCDWAGFHFYDLIFPMFVFIVGVSLVFSVRRMIERSGRLIAVKRIIIRSVTLFLLGVFYMGGVADGFKNIYLVGVLHRIAVAYFFTGLIFCFFDSQPRGHVIMAGMCALFLVGYWALMTFVPVPGIGQPSLDVSGKNLAHYIDSLYLPGKKFEGTILSTMTAVANCLLGVFAGLLLQNQTRSPQSKVIRLIAGGLASLLLGFAWAQFFPIIKILWTSSYVLVACGYSAILLGIFYQIVDIMCFEKWARAFIWVGMNPITIYIAGTVVNWRRVSLRFVGGDIAAFLGKYSDLVTALVGLTLALCLAYFLYRRQIFLRL